VADASESWWMGWRSSLIARVGLRRPPAWSLQVAGAGHGRWRPGRVRVRGARGRAQVRGWPPSDRWRGGSQLGAA
jgi:hypothetical protein